MAAKKATKREFDWRTYGKPHRLLTDGQQTALGDGILRPLLDAALGDDAFSLQIRAKQAVLYCRGAALVRLLDGPDGLTAQIDANLRLPRAERPGAERLETRPLSGPDDVRRLLDEIAQIEALLNTWALGEPVSRRERLTQLAAANGALAGPETELLVVDVEYQYGRRRFDFVGLRRAAGVGGLGAFTTPRLVIGELFAGERTASALSGLESFGADAAEFAHALSGEHLMRAKAELGELVAQKVGLGLLPPGLPFSHFTADAPEILAAFCTPDFSDSALDAPIAALHDRLVARHFPTELLSFAAIGEAREDGEPTLTIAENDLLAYRAFKGMRKRLASQ